MAAMLPIMAKPNVILRSEYVNTQKKSKGNSDSDIKEHLLFCSQTPDFEDFSILTTNNNDLKLS